MMDSKQRLRGFRKANQLSPPGILSHKWKFLTNKGMSLSKPKHPRAALNLKHSSYEDAMAAVSKEGNAMPQFELPNEIMQFYSQYERNSAMSMIDKEKAGKSRTDKETVDAFVRAAFSQLSVHQDLNANIEEKTQGDQVKLLLKVDTLEDENSRRKSSTNHAMKQIDETYQALVDKDRMEFFNAKKKLQDKITKKSVTQRIPSGLGLASNKNDLQTNVSNEGETLQPSFFLPPILKLSDNEGRYVRLLAQDKKGIEDLPIVMPQALPINPPNIEALKKQRVGKVPVRFASKVKIPAESEKKTRLTLIQRLVEEGRESNKKNAKKSNRTHIDEKLLAEIKSIQDILDQKGPVLKQ